MNNISIEVHILLGIISIIRPRNLIKRIYILYKTVKYSCILNISHRLAFLEQNPSQYDLDPDRIRTRLRSPHRRGIIIPRYIKMKIRYNNNIRPAPAMQTNEARAEMDSQITVGILTCSWPRCHYRTVRDCALGKCWFFALSELFYCWSWGIRWPLVRRGHSHRSCPDTIWPVWHLDGA